MAKARGGSTWDPDHYATKSRYVSDLGEPLIALLAPERGERILDLGCGDGALSEKLAATGCRVVAVDSSESMVAAARERGLDSRLADVTALEFDREFDGAFSNAVLHWVLDPDAAIDGVARALKPGSRFVGEFGGAGNVAAIVVALAKVLSQRGVLFDEVSPWYFPSVEDYRGRLERSGFRVDSIELFERPTSIAGDIVDWLNSFAVSMLDPFGEQVYREVRDLLREDLFDGEGWTVDYVRLRFSATLHERGEGAGRWNA